MTAEIVRSERAPDAAFSKFLAHVVEWKMIDKRTRPNFKDFWEERRNQELVARKNSS